MIIESGSGNGRLARVDSGGRLSVAAFNLPFQHVIAKENQATFQVWGTANLASGTVTPLHLKNNSSDKILVLTYLRWQLVSPAGGTPIPNVSNYLTFGFGATYTSGGNAATPVNMSSGSSVVSTALAYKNNPTLGGSLQIADRHYPSVDAEMYTYNKEGSTNILAGSTFTAQYVGDHTSGLVYVRASFCEVDSKSYGG